jgi:hypothetical protein
MGALADHIARSFDGGALGAMIAATPMHVIEAYVRRAIDEHPRECESGCEFPDPDGAFERAMEVAKRFDHTRQTSPIAWLCRIHMAIEPEEVRRNGVATVDADHERMVAEFL